MSTISTNVDTLCVVSCGKKKTWDVSKFAPQRVKAREAYVGPLVRLMIQYAERFHSGNWVILSAKYGFLWPDEEIEPYDVTFPKRVDLAIIDKLRRQAEEKGLTRYRRIVVLGSRRYSEVVKLVFRDREVVAPLAGLGLYKMMQKLREALDRGTPLA